MDPTKKANSRANLYKCAQEPASLPGMISSPNSSFGDVGMRYRSEDSANYQYFTDTITRVSSGSMPTALQRHSTSTRFPHIAKPDSRSTLSTPQRSQPHPPLNRTLTAVENRLHAQLDKAISSPAETRSALAQQYRQVLQKRNQQSPAGSSSSEKTDSPKLNTQHLGEDGRTKHPNALRKQKSRSQATSFPNIHHAQENSRGSGHHLSDAALLTRIRARQATATREKPSPTSPAGCSCFPSRGGKK